MQRAKKESALEQLKWLQTIESTSSSEVATEVAELKWWQRLDENLIHGSVSQIRNKLNDAARQSKTYNPPDELVKRHLGALLHHIMTSATQVRLSLSDYISCWLY